MRKYIQETVKLSCNDITELINKINELKMSANMPISINTTTGNITDTKMWYKITYFKQI